MHGSGIGANGHMRGQSARGIQTAAAATRSVNRGRSLHARIGIMRALRRGHVNTFGVNTDSARRGNASFCPLDSKRAELFFLAE
jgi:hypothetical protein